MPTNYEVVLKLFGTVTAQERALASLYSAAVAPEPLTVLYDLGDANSSSELSAKARSSMPTGVRTCFYSFSKVKELYPLMPARFRSISRRWREQTRKFMFVAKNFMVEPPLVLMRLGLLEGCTATPTEKFVWAIEADAAFAGDPRSFFDAFQADASDLLSTGYTIADYRWWGYMMQTWEDKLKFRRDSLATQFGAPLPEPHCGREARYPPTSSRLYQYYRVAIRDDLRYAGGQCNASGAVFRLIMVERYSPRLLSHLATLLADGRFATSEVFASSACALAASWCTFGDWARADDRSIATSASAASASALGMAPTPSTAASASARAGAAAALTRRHSKYDGNLSEWLAMEGVLPARGFRSAHFYYHPARFGYVESWCDVCDCARQEAMRGQWYHPVGELKPSLRFDHPAVWDAHRRDWRTQRERRFADLPQLGKRQAAHHTVERCIEHFPRCAPC